MGLPQAVEVHRRFRRVAQEPPDERLLLGETYVLDLQKLMRYVVPDGLHLCMNLVFLHADFDAEELARIVAETEALYPPGGTPVWHASSHDDVHFATRWCNGDEGAIRCTLVALLSLRGTCILFQGDEIGMEAVPLPADRVRDVAGRDPGRTPMVWSDEEGAGFTAPGVEPWLPIGRRDRNVAAQRDDPDSILVLTRDLVELRKRSSLLTGAYTPLDAPPGVWAFRREGGALVALNLGDERAVLDGVTGTIELGTDRRRDGERLTGVLELNAREAVVADACR
jgi:alpha-glucosidase